MPSPFPGTTAQHSSPPVNPFSSQAVRPGAIPFLSAGCLEADLDELVSRLHQNRGWGQIVGPHGSGKSTLLAALVPELEVASYHIQAVALRDGQRRLPGHFPDFSLAKSVVIVDGYEQLGRLARWRLKKACRRHDHGLLVTSHAPVGLPTLLETRVTVAVAKSIVERLLTDRDFSVDDAEIANLLEKHGGNLRDVLFDLYDRYEQAR